MGIWGHIFFEIGGRNKKLGPREKRVLGEVRNTGGGLTFF